MRSASGRVPPAAIEQAGERHRGLRVGGSASEPRAQRGDRTHPALRRAGDDAVVLRTERPDGAPCRSSASRRRAASSD